MNSCNFIGRLTKDPEAKSTANGKVFCNFSIAVDRGYKDSQGNKQVDFIPCTAWEATSNLITKYFHKGDLIGLNGRLESRAYEDNGAKKTAYSVLVNNIDFIQGKNETKEPKPQEEPVTPTADPITPEQMTIDDTIEDGVPFEI